MKNLSWLLIVAPLMALVAGCSTHHSSPRCAHSASLAVPADAAPRPDSPSWSLHGEIIDTCNCEVICPCMVGAAPTEGRCLTHVTWCIDEGRFGTTNLSGLTVVLAAHAPGPKFNDGNWRLAMYGDVRATADQRQALQTIFLGRAGGFFDRWRTNTKELLGVKWVPIHVERSGRKRLVHIREVLDIEAEGLAGRQKETYTELSNAPFWKGAPFPARIGRSTQYRYRDYDLRWEAPRRACSFSEFHYEGP